MIKALKARAAAYIAKSLSSLAAGWIRGDEETGDGGAVMSDAYTQSVWVYSCVSALGGNLAQIPFEFSKGARKGESRIEAGPLVELFARPHPQVDRFAFFELLVSWLCIRGEVFIVALGPDGTVVNLAAATRGSRRIGSLVILNPAKFRHIVTEHVLQGWQYTAGTWDPHETMALLPEEVIHLKLPNPYDFWRGLSPMMVARLAASTDFASAQFMKGLMMNNADTGVIVTMDQWPSEEQRELILMALKERKRKAGTADRPLLLAGGAKVEKPALAAADMQFLENRKFNRQEICSIFGVPQEILGFSEDANRSVGESSRLNFIENRVLPLGERIEAALAPVVTALAGLGTFGFFNADELPIMQAARRARIDSAVKLFGMGIPLNDITDQLDLGFPAYAWGNVGYLPFSLAPAGSAPADPAAPAATDPATEDPAAAPSKLFTLLGRVSLASAPAPSAHVCAPANPEYDADLRSRTKLTARTLKTFLFDQRSRVLSRLDQISRAQVLLARTTSQECGSPRDVVAPSAARGERAVGENPGLTTTPQTRSQPAPVAVRSIDDLWDPAEEDEALLKRLRPVLISHLEFGGAQLWREVGKIDFTLSPTAAIEFLAVREKKIVGINQTTFETLRESLQQGIEGGESMELLADRVRAVFNEISDRRADVIALTETNTAMNVGRHEGMVTAGIELKSWKTSNLEGVRPTHMAAEAASEGGIPISERFANGLRFPGDPEGPASEVINCRCFAYPVLPPAAAGWKGAGNAPADPIKNAPGRFGGCHHPSRE